MNSFLRNYEHLDEQGDQLSSFLGPSQGNQSKLLALWMRNVSPMKLAKTLGGFFSAGASIPGANQQFTMT